MKKSFLALCLLLGTMLANAATFSTFDSRTDFRDESIYFILTTRFFDGDSSNNTYCWDSKNKGNGDPEWRGDFKGLIERLDYIKALGFTAVWITPVVENASGFDYHGYHAIDFSKVDRRLESDGVTFKDVCDAAHARGMKIILDIVLNHTGNFGERNLCPMFNRDWTANQTSAEACMKVIPQSEGGVLPANYASLQPGFQYAARLAAMKNTDGKNHDVHNYWHHFANFNWDDPTRWWAQIAGDCVDLNTENPAVYNYLIKCYKKFIDDGVDGFRIDTSGHIARLTFNKAFIPAFTEAGAAAKNKRGAAASEFFMFGEICARYSSSVCYRDHDNLSAFYYTWKESKNYAWDDDPTSFDNIVAMEGDGCNTHVNHKSAQQQGVDDFGAFKGPQSDNAFLNGNEYHTPDHSKYSGFSCIDFPMHWTFGNANGAFQMGRPDQDKYYNDATFNVVYVDSHDYGPDSDCRYAGGQKAWAENMNLMFTYRGIPCLYYGSEVEFQKGNKIDEGPNLPLANSGRGYFGGYLTGTVEATDFGKYNATGNVAATLSQPLAQHVRRLNQIRQAIPALRKGQYSRDNCNGGICFKRRYKEGSIDSYVLVAISGNATFSNILNGTYVDAITGDKKTVSDGKLSCTVNGQGDLRIYVLNGTGMIGEKTPFTAGGNSSSSTGGDWDGNQNDGTNDDNYDPTDNPGGGQGGGPVVEPENPIEACLNSADEDAVFFTAPDNWSNIHCYVWRDGNTNNAPWPGKVALYLGNKVYKYSVPAGLEPVKIIWNNGNSGGDNQTSDLDYKSQYMYSKDGATSTKITAICDEPTEEPKPLDPPTQETGFCVPEADVLADAVYFTNPNNWDDVACYIWDANNGNEQILGAWPGTKATKVDGGYVMKLDGKTPTAGWKIIWNNNNQGSKTDDLNYVHRNVYDMSGAQGLVEACSETAVETVVESVLAQKFIYNGQLYIICGDVIYNAQGQLVR